MGSESALEENPWLELMKNFDNTEIIKKFQDYYVKVYGRIQLFLKRIIIYKSENCLLRINF